MERPHRKYYVEDITLDSEKAPGGVLVYYADGDKGIIHVNQYIIDLFECESLDEFLKLTGGSFYGFVHADDINAVEDSIRGQVETLTSFGHTSFRIKTKTGRPVSVESFGQLVEEAQDRPIFYVFVSKVTGNYSVDWLTGLPDMQCFLQLAQLGFAAISDRGGKPAIAALDLMGLKGYNTRYGRDEGDKLLCCFADALRKHFGSEACSRFSEDHFYAFCAEEDLEEKLKTLFADFTEANGRPAPPVRAGAYASEPGEVIDATAIDRARIACDLDRKTWQSHFTWFNDEMRNEARLHIHVCENVDQAIAEGWIRPYYQPIVRAATGRVCSEEALARWLDPEHGMLSPNLFVPVLEEAGLIYKVDMHMIDCVIADIVKKREQGIDIVPVSVNLSHRDFEQLDIVHEVLKKANAAGIPHSLLRIEFTESAASSNPHFFQTQVDALHAAGFDVWMDDFGSAYSSLNTLQEFEFDLIKLDMGFLKGFSDTDKPRSIIMGVIQAASRMHVNTLAEGVETEEQAQYLEQIGCSFLQGYFYAKPTPLETIIERAQRGEGLVREDMAELAYWNAISAKSLTDPAANGDDQGTEDEPTSEFPVGILERRGEAWSVVRANEPYRVFLDKTNMLSLEHSNLQANLLENPLDDGFNEAIDKCLASGGWETITDRMVDIEGFQFHVKPIASTEKADAFMIVGNPTMLGSALGAYGDVPVGYAVFRVVLNDAEDAVVDAEYVYANKTYCEWGRHKLENLIGHSFLETNKNATTEWFPYSYRATVLGEDVHDMIYSPELGHWLSFNISPSPVKGCCVYAYSIADEERREREEMIVGRDTSDMIIEITNALDSESDYETAMNGALEAISSIIRPDRLFIYERNSQFTRNTFEWLPDKSHPHADSFETIDNTEFDAWSAIFDTEPFLLVPDISVLRETNRTIYDKLTSRGITHLLSVPLYENGKLIGALGADNYDLDERIDTKRLLLTIAPFISARIINHRLVSRLEWTSTHDNLTGLLNRHGADQAIGSVLAESPEAPFALALIDIDDFKKLNDLHGHSVGDEALNTVTRTLQQIFPEDAIIGRNGGDEFLVMLFDENSTRAGNLIERFSRQDLSFECKGGHFGLTVSVGYVKRPEQVDRLSSAYSKAAAALYAVKLTGKAGCKEYSPSIDAHH